MNDETNVLVKLKDHDNKINELSRRVDKVEEQSNAINDLAISVKELAININIMNEKQTKQDERLTDLENKPAKRWEQVISTILTGLVGALLGFLLSRIGL